MSKNKESNEPLSLVEAPERSGGGSTSEAAPSNEVLAKPERRRFTAEYKRQVLREADACKKPGELGALLRREGLYTSHLSAWRRARERGEISGLAPKKRGRKARQRHERDERIVELERDVQKLKKRAERAEALVEIQKKVSQLLGIQLPSSDEGSS
jgi:transposase